MRVPVLVMVLRRNRRERERDLFEGVGSRNYKDLMSTKSDAGDWQAKGSRKRQSTRKLGRVSVQMKKSSNESLLENSLLFKVSLLFYAGLPLIG